MVNRHRSSDERQQLQRSASETIEILRDLGYSLNALVRVLDEEFKRGVNSITNILLGRDFSAADTAAAIGEVLGL